MSEPAKPPVPAATILLLRDGAAGLEVFMVKRHHQIDFVAGALVFPGGKVEASDADPVLRSLSGGGEDWSDERHALGAGAIREAFEESGILLARDSATDTLVTAERLETLQPYRAQLDGREIALADMLAKEKLRLALDQLVHFAHWITPTNMPKRFDTHFFLAQAPEGQIGRHDGRESVDSIWIGPGLAVSDRKRWNVVFPTKLNLVKLGKSDSVARAIAAARADTVLPVTPWIENGPDGQMLHIRADAGYDQTSASLREAT
jgi:8-oxo-dGTP pyrophosphatase MutT (NUDIX family)